MDREYFCGTPAAFDEIPGRSAQERFASLGLESGKRLDLGSLAGLHERYGFAVYLYFDEHLARTSTLQDDLEDFRIVPEAARPFMPLPLFLRTIREHDPGFSPESVVVEVIDCSAMQETYGCVLRPMPYVRGLLLEPGQ
ncbi:hypothetical protein FGU65_08840 [Methanoculleus sp. FWC-SCC1]|uniref:Uncharacterized protein n=1 Tax=Methanoculleus frigidifontis TaxID=2584085 RepID=A0ABT8MAN1_9EURY|nr:hypothetical protein [Methanoculleus sp. FWC-SCC1]MDN7024990.1 hypothetical protein [Methanoculleus sp. FWC-SCC1]